MDYEEPRTCASCRHGLGWRCCAINLEAECGEGGFEAWEPREDRDERDGREDREV